MDAWGNIVIKDKEKLEVVPQSLTVIVIVKTLPSKMKERDEGQNEAP